jgi:hypothetical protein
MRFLGIFALLLLVFGCTQLSIDENKTGFDKNMTPPQKKTDFAYIGLGTNTAIASVDLSQVLSGGPKRDGIPAIRNPKFTALADASPTITPQTLGIALGEKEKKFYPYNILLWHEIANDVVDGEPVAVTFCPLCGSAIVFSREVDGEVLEFGVSGLLYQSNLLMYDDKTESLWSQVRGEAIVGDYTGKKLTLLGSSVMTFSDFSEKFPDGKVLSTDTGYSRDYTFNPYEDYEASEEVIFPISDVPKKLPLKELVFAVPVGDKVAVFPLEKLNEEKQASLTIDGETLTVSVSGGVTRAFIDGNEVPGYHAMYFSIASQEENVVVWE